MNRCPVIFLSILSLLPLACDGEATLDGAPQGYVLDVSLPEDYVPPEEFEPPAPITDVDTLVTPLVVQAGERVDTACEIFDAEGLPVEFTEEEAPRERIFFDAEGSFGESDEGDVIAVRAGNAQITCTIPDMGLVDTTPAEIEIVPGDPHTVITYVSADIITAGDTVDASCEVFDAYGNLIPDAEPELLVAPTGEGVSVDGLSATLTTAGLHQVACSLPGTQVEEGQEVDVLPGAPAEIIISKSPDQGVYGIGQVVTFTVIVTDAYGNIIPNADADVTSDPAAESFGDDRYRFNEEGTFSITATIEGVEGPLTATTEVIINGTGPTILCDSPSDGEMLDMAPGGTVTFRGSTDDANGIARVTINGTDAAIGRGGTFSHDVKTSFGINFIDITTEDNFGAQNSRTCAFLVSDTWEGMSGFLDDGITLRLAQSAFDDGNRNDGLDSLNDLIYTMLNSSGLRNTLHSELNRSPVLKDSCDQRVCPCFGGCCFCAHHSKITYRDTRIGGPHSTSLDLVSGGLRARVTLRDINVQVRVDSTLYDGTGWARFNEMSVDITFNVRLRNGRPDVTLNRINSVSISNVDLDFPGFGGVIIDILQALFQGQIRNLVRDQLRNYLRDNINSILDDLLSGLDINSLGSSFNVPQLDGSGTVRLSFSLRFSSLPVNSTRALFGIGPRFQASIQHGGPSLGAPIPPGTMRLDPSTNKAVGATVHVGVFNQALHALWRGGLFDATLDGSTLGGSFPDGTHAKIVTNLPPVAYMKGENQVGLDLGAMRVELVYPGFFDESLIVTLGARATTGVALNRAKTDLNFSNVVIDELYFSTDQVSLSPSTRNLVESFLLSLLQDIVDSALNDALPALPIPNFTIPSSLGTFGLPVGATLGLLSPALSQSTNHFVLTGNFGTQ